MRWFARQTHDLKNVGSNLSFSIKISMSIFLYILILTILFIIFIYVKFSKNLATLLIDTVLKKHGINRVFVLIGFFTLGFFLQHLYEWYSFFLANYSEEPDSLILSILILTYFFSTQKHSVLNSNEYICTLKKIMKTVLGGFIFFIFLSRIYKLFYFGYSVEPEIITFNYYIPIPLKWIILAYYRIEVILWSITPFLENSLISFFGIQTNFFLIVLTEIVILLLLLLIVYQCWFKKLS